MITYNRNTTRVFETDDRNVVFVAQFHKVWIATCLTADGIDANATVTLYPICIDGPSFPAHTERHVSTTSTLEFVRATRIMRSRLASLPI